MGSVPTNKGVAPAFAPLESEVVCQVMAADLQHPGRFRGGIAQDAQVVIAAAPTDRPLVEGHQGVIGEPNLVEHGEPAGRQRGGKYRAGGRGLPVVEISEPQAAARHDADGQV
jgi:hypothetical protein